jgi:hypothetical protein
MGSNLTREYEVCPRQVCPPTSGRGVGGGIFWVARVKKGIRVWEITIGTRIWKLL